MNSVIRITLLCTLAFTTSTASLAQRRGANNAGRKVPAIAAQLVCEGEPIPKGYVIVGHKASAKCGDNVQVIIKKPDDAEIVCNGSPIPDGYHIANQISSTNCLTRGANSSLNALSIVSNGVIGSGLREASPDDSQIGRAFATRARDIQVEGEGRVIRLLPDDLKGQRHQRFIVQLASEQTLLVTHNIDIAPRIEGLKVGDSVRFNGEYVWNEKGGVIHWTHHDPQGRHVTGWVKLNGKKFQ